VARSPQQNGVVERRNRTLIEAARTMLIYEKAPLFLWAEAVATACCTQNRSIIRLRHGKTPYELLHDKLPDLSFFHVFGALCYQTNNSKNLGKLQPKADIDFDELTTMAFEHSNLEPALHEMTPATISSGLVPNPPTSTPFVPPSRIDWDILFQPLFDELLNPSSSVDLYFVNTKYQLDFVNTSSRALLCQYEVSASGRSSRALLCQYEVVELYFVNTKYQLADIFTKALGRERIEFLINKLGIITSITKEQQQALDDALVPREQRLRIGNCNYRLSTTFKPKEPTFQVALDVLSLTPFYQAFLISASVPAIYMHEFWATVSFHKQCIKFKLNKKNHSFDLETFRDML
ncbi:retrovirus-related pol polyprotein from transposon TNT 1-94, partial [Tanacetum coccineum]